jgi:hypothetical protein
MEGAENSSILRALVANGRGAKRPHFGKQGYNWTYFPHEPKRMDLRVFSKEDGEFWRKSEPV